MSKPWRSLPLASICSHIFTLLCLVLAIVLLIEGFWVAATVLLAATALHETLRRRQRSTTPAVAVPRHIHPPR
jgi:hypothetical protein